MHHPAIFAEQPFTGMLATGPSQEAFEILDESFAQEIGRGRAPVARSRPARAATRRPARPQRPAQAWKPPPRRPRPPVPWPPIGGGYPPPFVAEPFGGPYAAPGADTLRCVQECLGRGSAPAPQAAPGAAPADDAAAAPDAPSDAPADAAPDAGGDAGAPAAEEFEFHETGSGFIDAIGRIGKGIGSGIGQVIGRAGEALRDCKIIDLTAQSDRSVRKGTRDPKSVYALVLHQMACCFRRRDPMRSYLRIKAHFAILPEGQILQLHPVSALIWASHGFNSKSVAVEFAGNFPNVKGRWWKGETYGRDRVTPAQLEAGRCLVRHLKRTMGLRVVLAHRQSSNMRENDPGPDVWYHVGQWAVDNLGLSDGGAGFKVGTGHPIPDAWRTWGRAGGAARPAPELEFEFAEHEDELAYEDEGQGEYERGDEYEDESGNELWRGEPEGEVVPGLLGLAAAIADPRSAGPGIYTIYKNGQRLYVGRANHLRRRLQQHLWCLAHLKIGVGRFSVKLTPMRGATPAQLGRVEAAVIDRFGRRSQGGQLANVKARELEQELGGEAWR
ncbi:N-acetylmuramoyl-L-alanine amidase [Variovorax sp. LjRoot130]|uniref:N-acetylmuramoyl-L-alanine amidase n=1 Tax=Variovorax sp. LjRoot130 TaxID=3342261 RepID=UPI003ECE4895